MPKYSQYVKPVDPQVQSDWTEANPLLPDYIKHKPTIPAAQIQSDWTQANTGLLDFIKNKPTIPAAQIQSDWTQANSALLDFIKNKPTIPAAQIQSDWNQTNNALLDYIKNKPSVTIAPAANTADNIPQWDGLNSKTLKDGLAVPAGGLAGLTLVNTKVTAPANNTADYLAQWNGADSKTLKDGLAVPAGGLAGITALNLKQDTANIRTTWQVTPDNTHYPSEKLAKDSLDGKLANSALGTVNQVLHGNPSGAMAFSPVVEADLLLAAGSSVNNTIVGTHGLAPALSGVNTQFLRGDGAWAAPANVTVPNAYAEESFAYTANVAHNIVHNFGARPLVQCITASGDIIIPLTINHLNLDTVVITFDDSATYDVVLTLGSMPLDVYVSTSISYSMLVADTLIEVTAGSKIITLVTPVGRVGKKITVKNSSVGVCDVITAAGLIEGVADVTIPSKNSYDFTSNGSNWIVT